MIIRVLLPKETKGIPYDCQHLKQLLFKSSYSIDSSKIIITGNSLEVGMLLFLVCSFLICKSSNYSLFFQVKELFGAGTACVVCPVDKILYEDEVIQNNVSFTYLNFCISFTQGCCSLNASAKGGTLLRKHFSLIFLTMLPGPTSTKKGDFFAVRVSTLGKHFTRTQTEHACHKLSMRTHFPNKQIVATLSERENICCRCS